MATTLDSDIDRFIRDQKAKLANERHILKKDDSYFATDVPRRQWNREEARSAKLAEQIQEERTRTPDGGLPLTNTDSFKKRQELALQRKQEYKDFIEKTSQNGRKRLNRPLTPADDMGLPVGQYQKNRRELSLQRQKEYQEYLQQKQKSQDNSLRTAKDGQLSDYQLMSKQLSQQKRQEYNQTSHGHHEDILKKLEEQYKLLRTDAEKKYLKAALEDVKQEYEAKWAAQRAQQQQDKSIVDSHTASTNLENGAQGDDYKALWSRVHLEKTEELKENDKRRQWEPVKGKAVPDSSDLAEAVRKKLADERKKEYEEIIKSTGGGHTNLVKQTDEYKATFPGMNESDAAKVLLSKREVDPWSKPYVKHDRNFVDIKPYSIQKVRERNAEYNEFLNQKQDREGRSRYGDQKPSLSSREEGVYATLPGLNYSNSASKRRVQERNQEYNEFLRNKGVGTRQVSHGDDDIGRPPPAPRKGWTTPTYEEMLDKKRQQESQYRRLNDPGFSQLPLRSYNSEGALNTLETERRLRELDKEWGAK